MRKSLTYLVPLLIVTGLAKNYFYYNAFNIRIFDYLDLSETLTIITEYSILILITIPLTWFGYFMLDMKKEHITDPENHKDLIEVAHEEVKFMKRCGLYLLRYWGLSIVIIILFILSLLMRFNFFRYNMYLEVILITMLSLIAYIILILEYRYKYKRLFGKEIEGKTATILHYGGFFVIFMTLYTYAEIIEIKNRGGGNKNYSIELNTGKILTTSKELRVIGQTRSHFFLFDITKEETTVIKKDLINEIRIK